MARLVSWLLNDGACEGVVERHRASSASADGSEETLIRLSIPASLKRTGKEMKFVVDGVANSAPADTTLIRLLRARSEDRQASVRAELSADRGHRA